MLKIVKPPLLQYDGGNPLKIIHQGISSRNTKERNDAFSLLKDYISSSKNSKDILKLLPMIDGFFQMFSKEISPPSPTKSRTLIRDTRTFLSLFHNSKKCDFIFLPLLNDIFQTLLKALTITDGDVDLRIDILLILVNIMNSGKTSESSLIDVEHFKNLLLLISKIEFENPFLIDEVSRLLLPISIQLRIDGCHEMLFNVSSIILTILLPLKELLSLTSLQYMIRSMNEISKSSLLSFPSQTRKDLRQFLSYIFHNPPLVKRLLDDLIPLLCASSNAILIDKDLIKFINKYIIEENYLKCKILSTNPIHFIQKEISYESLTKGKLFLELISYFYDFSNNTFISPIILLMSKTLYYDGDDDGDDDPILKIWLNLIKPQYHNFGLMDYLWIMVSMSLKISKIPFEMIQTFYSIAIKLLPQSSLSSSSTTTMSIDNQRCIMAFLSKIPLNLLTYEKGFVSSLMVECFDDCLLWLNNRFTSRFISHISNDDDYSGGGGDDKNLLWTNGALMEYDDILNFLLRNFKYSSPDDPSFYSPFFSALLVLPNTFIRSDERYNNSLKFFVKEHFSNFKKGAHLDTPIIACEILECLIGNQTKGIDWLGRKGVEDIIPFINSISFKCPFRSWKTTYSLDRFLSLAITNVQNNISKIYFKESMKIFLDLFNVLRNWKFIDNIDPIGGDSDEISDLLSDCCTFFWDSLIEFINGEEIVPIEDVLSLFDGKYFVFEDQNNFQSIGTFLLSIRNFRDVLFLSMNIILHIKNKNCCDLFPLLDTFKNICNEWVSFSFLIDDKTRYTLYLLLIEIDHWPLSNEFLTLEFYPPSIKLLASKFSTKPLITNCDTLLRYTLVMEQNNVLPYDFLDALMRCGEFRKILQTEECFPEITSLINTIIPSEIERQLWTEQYQAINGDYKSITTLFSLSTKVRRGEHYWFWYLVSNCAFLGTQPMPLFSLEEYFTFTPLFMAIYFIVNNDDSTKAKSILNPFKENLGKEFNDHFLRGLYRTIAWLYLFASVIPNLSVKILLQDLFKTVKIDEIGDLGLIVVFELISITQNSIYFKKMEGEIIFNSLLSQIPSSIDLRMKDVIFSYLKGIPLTQTTTSTKKIENIYDAIQSSIKISKYSVLMVKCLFLLKNSSTTTHLSSLKSRILSTKNEEDFPLKRYFKSILLLDAKLSSMLDPISDLLLSIDDVDVADLDLFWKGIAKFIFLDIFKIINRVDIVLSGIPLFLFPFAVEAIKESLVNLDLSIDITPFVRIEYAFESIFLLEYFKSSKEILGNFLSFLPDYASYFVSLSSDDLFQSSNIEVNDFYFPTLKEKYLNSLLINQKWDIEDVPIHFDHINNKDDSLFLKLRFCRINHGRDDDFIIPEVKENGDPIYHQLALVPFLKGNPYDNVQRILSRNSNHSISQKDQISTLLSLDALSKDAFFSKDNRNVLNALYSYEKVEYLLHSESFSNVTNQNPSLAVCNLMSSLAKSDPIASRPPDLHVKISLKAACLLWSRRSYPLSQIRREFLENLPINAVSISLQSKAYHTLASFFDDNITSKDFSETIKNKKDLQKIAKHKLNILCSENTGACIKDSSFLKVKKHLENQIKMDQNDIDELEHDIISQSLQAMDNFSKSLLTGDRYNIVIFRLCSLWFGLKRNTKAIGYMTRLLDMSHKFLPLLFQLSGRLDEGVDGIGSIDNFQIALHDIITCIACKHPHHSIPHLLSLSHSGSESNAAVCGDLCSDDHDKDGSSITTNSITDKSRKVKPPVSKRKLVFPILNRKKSSLQRKSDAASSILLRAKESSEYLRNLIIDTDKVWRAYIELAEIDFSSPGNSSNVKMNTWNPFHKKWLVSSLATSSALILTGNVSIDKSSMYDRDDIVLMMGWKQKAFRLIGGINLPKIVQCIGSDGNIYDQLVKGKDDLRQDSIMEQVFLQVNNIISSSSSKADIGRIRTFKVVPLKPLAGVLEWVPDSIPLGDYMSKAQEKYPCSKGNLSLREARHLMKDEFERAGCNPLSKLKVFTSLLEKFNPVFQYFFIERTSSLDEWFKMRKTFITSTAITSIIGWIVGLGDRHCQNIMIDKMSGELIHIDLNMIFDSASLLPVPERVPFRLTQNFVSSMGYVGVESVFKETCCEILSLLRDKKDLVLMILDVFVWDPLYKNGGGVNGYDPLLQSILFDHNEMSSQAKNVERDSENEDFSGNKDAERAIVRVKEKLTGYQDGTILSVRGHVSFLVSQATSVELLAQMYPGWQSWI